MAPSSPSAIALAARKVLDDNRGRAWPGGAVVDHLFYRTSTNTRVGTELKSFCVGLDALCTWIAEIEAAVDMDRATAAQMIRRLWYSPPVYNEPGNSRPTLFDRTIWTDTALLTDKQVSQSCLDGLARSGMLALTEPTDPDGMVDLSHVFVALDFALKGAGAGTYELKALIKRDLADASPQAMLGWQGDLGSVFMSVRDARQRWQNAHPGQDPPRGDPTNPSVPDTEAFWLAQAFQHRCPLNDLLGDFDGVILSHLIESGRSLADVIHDYYSPTAGTSANVPTVATRFASFLKYADPPIPMNGGAPAPGALDAITTIVTDGGRLLLRTSRARTDFFGGALGFGPADELKKEYATWVCGQAAARFLGLLRAGLAGGSLSSSWPADSPDPLNLGYPPVLYGRASARVLADPLTTDPGLAAAALEAAAQYYVNSPDPWGAAPPSSSILAPVRLGDVSGAHATARGGQTPAVVLADLYDPKALWSALAVDAAHRDLLWLQGAGSRPSKTYRIESVDPAARVIGLDADPQLASGSAWAVIRRPQLVLVDAMGSRPGLSASGAVVAPDAPDTVLIALDDNVRRALSAVNCGLDTMLLADARNIPRLPFRILEIDLSNPDSRARLRLDRAPQLSGQTRWQIPAGFGSGPSDAAASVPKSPGAGADHYDGVLFVVYRGKVTQSWPWTSFSSFVPDSDGNTHPIGLRGNRQYNVYGYRSSNAYKNFSFAVRETAWRDQAFSSDAQSDQVAGRHYLDGIGTTPFKATRPPVSLGNSPQRLVRMHYGNPVASNGTLSTGSAACLVSPHYYELRAELIRIHQLELRTLGQPEDTPLNTLAAADHQASEQLWNENAAVTASDWDAKVVANLILVRPDERPLSTLGELTPWVDS